jgi:hypothetical protein
MSEKSQLNFWSQRPEVTLQLNIGTIVMGAFQKIINQNSSFFYFIFQEKGDKRMSFFTTSVTGLKTVVTAIGAGVGVWGVINLLEGYGNDNPGAKSQGIKQLMSGGGIIIVAQTVIPQLTTLFS